MHPLNAHKQESAAYLDGLLLAGRGLLQCLYNQPPTLVVLHVQSSCLGTYKRSVVGTEPVFANLHTPGCAQAYAGTKAQLIMLLNTHAHLNVCANLANHIWIAKAVQVIVLYLQQQQQHTFHPFLSRAFRVVTEKQLEVSSTVSTHRRTGAQ